MSKSGRLVVTQQGYAAGSRANTMNHVCSNYCKPSVSRVLR